MNLLHLLFTRLFSISILIFLQIILFLGAVFVLSEVAPLIYILFIVFSMVIVIYVLMKDDNPAYKLSWCIIILMAPLFGGILYLILGNNRLPKKIRVRATAFNSTSLHQAYRNDHILSDLWHKDKRLGTIARYIDENGGFPVWENTSAEYFPSGENKFVRLLEELEKAEHYILLEYFIIAEGRMWETVHHVLCEKIEQGVEVYLIYDDVGCIRTLPHDYYKKLSQEGFHVKVFNPFRPRLNPFMNYRDHRKIVVIDGKTAFCGGINLADEYINEKPRFGYWKDTAVMIHGEAVWNLTETFFKMWNFCCQSQEEKVDISSYRRTIGSSYSDGYIQPFSDSPLDGENVSENFYLNVINRAKEYVYLSTPYLVIDYEMQTALCLAAKNGIDVRIITPGIPDKKTVFMVTRSNYAPLIEAGVRIYEYTPGFIHAKNMVSDDKIAQVGTINMDFRSFYFHFECGVAFYRSSVIESIREDMERTMAESQEITSQTVKEVPLFKRFARAFLKIFAPIM